MIDKESVEKCKKWFEDNLLDNHYDDEVEPFQTTLRVIEEWETLHDYYKDIITQIHNDNKDELARLREENRLLREYKNELIDGIAKKEEA